MGGHPSHLPIYLFINRYTIFTIYFTIFHNLFTIFTCYSPTCKLCSSFEIVCLGHLSMSEYIYRLFKGYMDGCIIPCFTAARKFIQLISYCWMCRLYLVFHCHKQCSKGSFTADSFFMFFFISLG